MSLQALMIWLAFGLGITVFAVSARARQPAYVQSEVRRAAPQPAPQARQQPPKPPKPKRIAPEIDPWSVPTRVAGGPCILCGMG